MRRTLALCCISASCGSLVVLCHVGGRLAPWDGRGNSEDSPIFVCNISDFNVILGGYIGALISQHAFSWLHRSEIMCLSWAPTVMWGPVGFLFAGACAGARYSAAVAGVWCAVQCKPQGRPPLSRHGRPMRRRPHGKKKEKKKRQQMPKSWPQRGATPIIDPRNSGPRSPWRGDKGG